MSRHRKQLGLYFPEALEPRLVLDSTVVFSEIMYNPQGSDESLEWIELHNQMAVNVDLSGWRLDDGVDFTFPEGTVLDGGGYLVVAANVDALAAETGLDNIWGPYSGNLSNGGEHIQLRNHTDRLLNEVEFDDQGEWPVLADGSGASLAKEYSQAASHLPENWRASEQVGGTPGRANFVADANIEQTTIVPLVSNWRYEQSGSDLGSVWREPGFNDQSWAEGEALLFVESSSLPGPKTTPLTLGQNTYYFRQQFEFDGDTESASLRLNHMIDDGAVFYLNGQEIGRFNLSANPTMYSSTADDAVTNAALASTLVPDAGVLVQGTNTLAVEVHQASSGSSDVVMGLEVVLQRVLSPTDLHHSIVFSESSGSDAANFWVELQNNSENEVDLTGYEMLGTEPGHMHVLSGVTIPAGGFVLIDQPRLGWRPKENERLFLYTPQRIQPLDALVVSTTPQARSAAHDARWQTPHVSTPGAVNAFSFETDVVINEIMYNARPTYESPGSVQSSLFLDFDHTWRYEQSGADLGTAWRSPSYDDADWAAGQGLLYVESSDLPGPKSTELTLGSRTFYFRSTFELDDPDSVQLAMEHVIDDGAVFYLNGVEIDRFNMPDGIITHETRAVSTVRNGLVESGTVLPNALLVPGMNYLAVEVHQQTSNNPDIAFGLRLNVEEAITPATEYSESDEEWIELYNRGDNPIDLTGWRFSDGIQFDFEAATTLNPGEYAIVARNAAQVRSLHPGIRILGEFSGTLSNSEERIQLNDANGNIADEVRYYEDGRWAYSADGNGSTLELRDPFANNATAEAWGASDESERSEWQRVSYSEVADAIPNDPPINFHEFVMGLLARGEVWIDNLSVTTPDGTELLQNGNFESDTIGAEPERWRIQGTHEHSEVVVDPDDDSNQFLRLVAEARTNYLGNHAETTLADGAQVTDGTVYTISYDAKWITGSPQLHTELYYQDAARTTILNQPRVSGTPGAVNSIALSNLGPTYEGLSHSPVIPTSSDAVKIQVTPDDRDGVRDMALLYSVDGGSFRSVDMNIEAAGVYSAEVPRQSNGRTVQFYVRGTDARGATTFFPAAGPDSSALYKVDNSFARDSLRHDFQIVMIPRDADALHVATNILDNDRVGSTVIYNGTEVFYNTGTRLRGSMFSRSGRSGTGYNVKFNADQLFRGIHESIGFDQGNEREIIAKFVTVQTGNLGGTYDDVFNLETPSGSGGGPTLVYLARHQDLFLDEQFENGSDGTLFKMEGIRVMTSTVDGQPESRKIYRPIGWVGGFDIRDHGEDKEKYRWPFIINNNRKQDDYSGLIDMAQAFSAPTSQLQARAMDVLDVDNVTHTFALMSLLGIGDAYSQGNPHNLNIYVRPNDDKVLMFPWDWDFTFNQSTTAPLHGNKNIGRILDQPHFEHFLLGHMEHMIETRFNRGYMTPWTAHFGQLLSDNYDQFLTRIRDRGNFVKGRLPDAQAFGVTATSVHDAVATIQGEGWVNVKEIRLSPDGSPIGVEWTSPTEWTASVPLVPGENRLNLMAFDFGGELLDTAELQVVSETLRPLHQYLRISEINYHPSEPTAAETAAGVFDSNAFEFIEIANASSGLNAQTLDLAGVTLEDAVHYSFPVGSTLGAGERLVVVADLVAFRQRYGAEPRVAGEYERSLSNRGETLALVDNLDVEITSVTYSDHGLWPEAVDGLGATLVSVSLDAEAKDAGKYYQWRSSVAFGGSPGRSEASASGVYISEILPTGMDSIELFNSGDSAVDLSGWFLSDDEDSLFDFEIPAGTRLGPGEYVVFDRSQFGFGLSSQGEDVWLVSRVDGNPHFIDEVHFAATSGQSLGVTEQSRGRLTSLTRIGLGLGNARPRVSDTTIHVINYLPAAPSAEALSIDPTLTQEELEYVAVDGPLAAGWQLSGGIEFGFQSAASGPLHWLVPFDPHSAANVLKVEAFKKHYAASDLFPVLLGGYQGSLKKTGEQILLQRPTGDGAFETVDEVIYDTRGDWPEARTGDPIVRRSSTFFGNDGRSWIHASDLPFTELVQGDFNGDNLANAADIDLLIDAVNRGSHNAAYVVSGTLPAPTSEEIRFYVQDVLGSQYGDTNLDGVVNDDDQHLAGRNAGGWQVGDFNGDNLVDGLDLEIAGIELVTYDFALFLRLSANFGQSGQTVNDGDLDGDMLVGFSDFLILSARFGS